MSNKMTKIKGIENQLAYFLKNMTSSHQRNIKLAKKIFDDIEIISEEDDGNLLHQLAEYAKEMNIVEAAKTLIDIGVDVNQKASFGYNFIQSILYSKKDFSEDAVYEISKYALANGFDCNATDEDGDTVLHTAILSDDYSGSVTKLASLFIKNGLNINAKNKDGYHFMEAMKVQNCHLGEERFSNKDFCDMYQLLFPSSEKESDQDSLIGEYLEKKEPHLFLPVDNKVKDMEISLSTGKSALLVGYERSGKSSMIQSLNAKMSDTPFFQIPFFDLISECNSVFEVGQNLSHSFDFCLENDNVAVLEDIDKFVEFSPLTREFIHSYLESGLKVVGTTNYPTYQKWIKSSDLNGYFYKTKVEDLTNSSLEKLMNHYYDNPFESEEVKRSLLSYLTTCKSEDSIISNMGLMFDVIDRASSYALNDGRDKITETDIQRCIKNDDNFTKIKK